MAVMSSYESLLYKLAKVLNKDDPELKYSYTTKDVFNLLTHFGGAQIQDVYIPEQDFTGNEQAFINFLNQNYGLDLPKDYEEFKAKSQHKPGLINFHELYEISMSDSNESAVEGVKVPRLRREMQPSLKQQKPELLKFHEAFHAALCGRIAFTSEECEKIRRDGDNAILVLPNYDVSMLHQLKHADGVIVLGEGGEHLEVVLNTQNLPALLFTEDPDHVTIETKSGSSSLIIGKQRFESGASMTMAGPALYEGAMKVNHSPFSDVEAFDLVAARAHNVSGQKGGLKVLGTAKNTAECLTHRTKTHCQLPDFGIGLLRTERMLQDTEILPAVQHYLAHGDEQSLNDIGAFQQKELQRCFSWPLVSATRMHLHHPPF